MKTVKISVQSGFATPEEIPEGVRVIIIDYDVASEPYDRDEDGTPCYIHVYEPEGDPNELS